MANEPQVTPVGRHAFASSVVGPNHVSLLRDGLQAYPAMLAAIAQATRTIFMETYTLQNDATGARFVEALCHKARAGVLVLLMYDDWGSRLPDSVRRTLLDAGVFVHVFRPLQLTRLPTRFLQRLTRRNHRKSLIVDSVNGFTGGLNIADEYAAIIDGGHGWRDTHLQVEGPAVRQLEQLFLKTWRTHAKTPVSQTAFTRAVPANGAAETSPKLRFIGNEFGLARKQIRKAYVEAIAHARSRILITNAYFLPPPRVLKSLLTAARRGVRVKVIIGANTDVKLVLYAIRGLYSLLLKAGVEVYEWHERILHAKTAVIDGHWSTVGSSNLDSMSLRRNLEVNAVLDDVTFGAAMERLFNEDLARCQQVTRETVNSFGWPTRALSFLALRLRAWL